MQSEVWSSTSILVTWDEVPPIDQNGIITVYEVLYEPQEISKVYTFNKVNTSYLEILLTDLGVFVTYNIYVRAYTSVGSGPYSMLITSQTLEEGESNSARECAWGTYDHCNIATTCTVIHFLYVIQPRKVLQTMSGLKLLPQHP